MLLGALLNPLLSHPAIDPAACQNIGGDHSADPGPSHQSDRDRTGAKFGACRGSDQPTIKSKAVTNDLEEIALEGEERKRASEEAGGSTWNSIAWADERDRQRAQDFEQYKRDLGTVRRRAMQAHLADEYNHSHGSPHPALALVVMIGYRSAVSCSPVSR
jgi:hypothetical protein